MFVRPCGVTSNHEAHDYEHVWKKNRLPKLYKPELYPDEWTAMYKCPGVEVPAAWEVETSHDDCKYCEAAADSAVGLALQEGHTTETWTEVEHVEWPAIYTSSAIGHIASVTRL